MSELSKILVLLLFLGVTGGCASGDEDLEMMEDGDSTEERGMTEEHGDEAKEGGMTEEHGGEAKEGGDLEEGDEEDSSVRFTKTETFDEVRRGVRLQLRYDSSSAAFVGTAENVSQSAVRLVRVEVHLSGGTELGPTTPVDLAPGDSTAVLLPTEGHDFETWSAHAETGRSEHGSEGQR